MDYLWSPWRYQYVSQGAQPAGCIFCVKAAEQRDVENLILHRARHCFALLNLYPYSTGHLMVAPYAHVASLAGVSPEGLAEMMELARTAERALEQVYHPDGLNLGMNLGKAAGAGVVGHVHMHVLPRWFADSNFMTVVGETRVIPEDLSVSYEKLKPYFQK
jgi:ATP adenylyltransferase